MAEINWEVWLPIVIAIISSVPGVIVLFKGKKKEQADVAETLVATATGLMNKMEEKMDDLEEDVINLRSLVDNYKVEVSKYKHEVEIYKSKVSCYQKIQMRLIKGIKLLIKQLEENNIVPAWQPNEDDLDVDRID